MSGPAAAADGAETPPPSPPPPQRRWWRVALWTVGGLLALLVVLHTPPVKRLVAAALVRLAGTALDAEVTLAHLDYRLWAGEVSLEGLVVHRPGLEIDCASAEVDLDVGTGLLVQVKGPQVVVTQRPETGEPEMPSLPLQPWSLLGRFHRIDLEEGALELRRADGTPWLRVEGLDALVEARGGGVAGSLRVAEAGLGWPAAGIRVEGVSASAEVELDPGTGTLQVSRAQVHSEDATLEGRGRLRQLRPVLASAEGEGRMDVRLLRKLAPVLELDGRLDARLSFEKDRVGTRGSLEVEVVDLEAWRVGPWSGSLRGTLEDRRLEVDSLSLEGYEGRAEATGAVWLGEGPTGLDVRVAGLDTRSLVGTYVDAPPPLASRIDGELHLGLRDWDMDTLDGSGRLSFRPGPGEGWPLSGPARVHLGEGRVAFEADGLRVRTARIATEGSFSFERDVDLRYVLRLPELQEAAELLAEASVEMPALALGGAAMVDGEVSGRLPEWRATARAASQGLSVEEIDVGLEGTLAVTASGIDIESLEAQGVDGSLAVAGFVPFGDEGEWGVDANVAELRLGDALALHGWAAPAAVTARGRARVEGPAGNPAARFEVDVHATPDSREGGDALPCPGVSPLEGAGAPEAGEDDSEERPGPEAATLRLAGSASADRLVVDEMKALVGGGEIEGSGSWIRDGGSFEATARIDGVQLARLPGLPVGVLRMLDARISGEADLSGGLESPRGRVQLSLAANRYREQTLPDVAFEATLDGTRAVLSGRLGDEPLLSGHVGFEDQWPLHLEVDLAALPLTPILRSLPGEVQEERSLRLNGRALLDLPLGDPEGLRYDASVDTLEVSLGGPGSVAGPFSVHGTRELVAIEAFDLRTGQSRLQVNGELGLASDASSPLTLRGDVPLADLAALVPDGELEGEASLDLRVGGRLAALDVGGEVGVRGRGRLGPVPLEEMELAATIRDGVLRLDRARVLAGGGEVTAEGSLPVGPRAQGRQILDVQVQGVDLGALLPVEEGDSRLVAPLDASARVQISGLALDALAVEGEITRWSVGVGADRLTLEKIAPWHLSAGKLVLDELRLSGAQGHLGVGGEWTPGGAARVRLSGDADLALINPLLGGDLLLSGPARLDLTVDRKEEELLLEGNARLENGRAVLRRPPMAVSGLTGSLEARGQSLELEASGEVGDGTLRTAGTISFSRGGPAVDLTLEAERVPLTFPEGLRSRSSGQLRLAGGEQRYRLEGDVAVHRALYERETDATNQSLDTLGAELRALEQRGSILERVQVDVRVRLENGLRIQNRQVQAMVDGALTVGGDLLTPSVDGSVSLREGGKVKLSRATMRLAPGRVSLNGFPSQPLEIDVSGHTQVTGIQIEVQLSGPLDDLQTTLSSPNRSDLTQADLATLLLTGRTAQAAASESGAIVAEEVAAALGSALNERLGGAVLIDVSRDESLIVQDTDPTQRFNIGIPLGERLYLIHSQALDRSGVRWILDLRPTGQFRVRLISDSDDTSAVEVSHGFDFDLWSRGRRAAPTEPKRPRVGQVRIEGVPETEAKELIRVSKLDPGEAYDFFEGDDATRRVEARLVDQGYRAALVEAAEKPVGERQVDVVLKVDRGPRIEVEWTGDDPGRKLRRRFGDVWDAYLTVEETASRRARTLRHELQARRYYEASVEARIEGADDVSQVTFDVTRGPRGRDVDLRFEGNSSLPDETLAAVLPPPDRAEFFALLEPAGRTRLETALRTAGARAGFLSLRAGRAEESFDPQTGRLQVTVPIEEGERAALVRLDLPETVEHLEGAAPPELRLRVGEPFRIDAYVDDRGTLASWYRRQGYPEARLASVLEPVPGGIAVRFDADPGPRPTVGAIGPGRAGRTRPSVVDGAVVLEPGDLIRPEDLSLSRDHLSETRAFRSVDVRAEKTEDAAVRDVVVDLVERPDLKVEYKVRYETGNTPETAEDPQPEESRGFQFGAGLEIPNPFGWAHRYSVYGLVGKVRQLFGATFESQTFLGRRWRTQVFVFDDSDRDYESSGITRRIRNVAFQQTKRWRSGLSGRRWHDRLRMQWGYSFRRINYLDPETADELAGDRGGVSNSLIGDTRDSVTDPHRGLFWTANVEPVLKALGSEKDYVRLYGQVFAYVPLGSGVVWAHGLRIGLAPGDDPLLLLDRRFKAGGATTVRGFAENALGPQYRDVGIGGQGLFVFNQELRFAVWDRVWGGVFYDAGNVWPLASEIDLADLRTNVGAGVRVMFPFGPLRLDWAWILNPREGEQRSRWVFALGHAF